MSSHCGLKCIAGSFLLSVILCAFVLPAEEPKLNEAAGAANSDAKPAKPKITVSKETTYVTEPLRADGCVDYVAALNQRRSEGVTPENNAMVLFWQAFGPKDIDPKIRKPYFEMLGISDLPENGDYFVQFADYLQQSMGWKQKFGDTPEDEEKEREAWKQLGRAQGKPWSKEEYPLFAALLEKNEKALQLIVDGAQRSRCYSPLIPIQGESLERSDRIMIWSDLRDAIRQLTLRAMLQFHQGEWGLAWSDLLTCYRLGRQSYGANCVAAMTFDSMASFSILAFAQHGDISAEQARRWQADLRHLPRRFPLRETWNVDMRLGYLDQIIYTAMRSLQERDAPAKAGRLPDLSGLGALAVHAKAKQLYITDPRIDWNDALRYCNARVDRAVAAFAQPSSRQQCDAWRRLRAEAEEFAGQAMDHASLPRVPTEIESTMQIVFDWIDKQVPGFAPEHETDPRSQIKQAVEQAFLPLDLSPNEVTHHYVDLVVRSSCTEGELVARNETTARTWDNLIYLALGLAAYRYDHQSYPRQLADLSPTYMEQIPEDPFADEAFHYRPEKDGYLIYSVGPNGKDDDGKNHDVAYQEPLEKDGEEPIDKSWDDIAIRMPRKQIAEE